MLGSLCKSSGTTALKGAAVTDTCEGRWRQVLGDDRSHAAELVVARGLAPKETGAAPLLLTVVTFLEREWVWKVSCCM